MSAKDIIGLFCDDITFCPYQKCRDTDCPRCQLNIRDHSIPHSYSIETPSDCPHKDDEAYISSVRGIDDILFVSDIQR